MKKFTINQDIMVSRSTCRRFTWNALRKILDLPKEVESVTFLKGGVKCTMKDEEQV